MNWKTLIENVDKSEENTHEVDLMTLGEREFGKFDVPWLNVEETPLKSYWYEKWLCTDTWVGGKIYFFDDEFVATSFQSARKAYEEFHWASKEAYEKVAAYLESIRQADNIAHLGIDFHDDLEEGIDVGYQLEYGTQLMRVHLDNECIVKNTGEKVMIVEHYNGHGQDEIKKWRNIKAKHENGVVKDYHLSDILFPYLLKK
jgi:hypothetical protein